MLTKTQLLILKKACFKNVKITKELREKTMNNKTGNTRQNLGLFYTDNEKQKYIRKSLKRKLP